MKRINVWWVFLLGFQVLSAQHSNSSSAAYRLPDGVTQADYLPGKLVFRIRDAYRSQCTGSSVNAAGFRDVLDLIGAGNPSQAIPGSQPPKQKFNELGQQMEDLSLIYTIDYSGALSVEQAATQLLAHPAVEYAEPWFVYQTFMSPNDNLYAYQWHIPQIHADSAWSINRGDTTVTIGIVDTGTSFYHWELDDKVQLNRDDPADGIDNDGDNYVDNLRGWDFGGYGYGSGGDNDPSFVGTGPASDHGVMVAGACVAETNNNLWISSVGYNTRYLPVKACIDNSISISYGYQGLVYAADQGCQIINLSWGGTGFSQFGQNAVDYAVINKGALVVAAAGNTHASMYFYPASYRGVLSVGATMYNDQVWIYGGGVGTSYNEAVDVMAPGRDIVTSSLQNDIYHGATGTSVASPVVAGVAALVKSQYPQYNMLQVGERVRVTSDDIYAINNNPAYTNKLGHGRVNALRALTEPTPSIRFTQISIADNQNNVWEHLDTLYITPTIVNYLDPVQNLQLVLQQPANGFVELLDSIISIPGIGMMDTIVAPAPFRVVVREWVAHSTTYALQIKYRSAPNYSDYQFMTLTLSPVVVHVNTNTISTILSDNGLLGYISTSESIPAEGLFYNGSGNLITSGTIVAGDATHVFRNEQMTSRRRYSVTPHTQEQYVSYQTWLDESIAAHPLGIDVSQEVIASSRQGESDFLIMRADVHNRTSGTLQGLFSGYNFQWYWGSSSSFAGRDARRNLSWFSDGSLVTAVGMLSPGQMNGSLIDMMNVDFSDSSYIRQLTSSYQYDPSSSLFWVNHLVSSDTFSLAPDQSRSHWYFLAFGTDTASVQALFDQAQFKFNCELNPGTVLNLGSDRSVCQGDTAVISVPPTFSQLFWSTGDTTHALVVQAPGTYHVEATTQEGCHVSDQIVITTAQFPNVNLGGTVHSCTPVTLDAGNTGYSFSWSTGDTSQTLVATESGLYEVEVVSPEGCIGLDDVTVFIDALQAQFTLSGAAPVSGNASTLNDLTTGATAWAWDFGDGTLSSQGPSVLHTWNQPGAYTVSLIVSNASCSDTVSHEYIVSAASGIAQQITGGGFTVWPTRNNGRFTVSGTISPHSPVSFRVISVDGRTLWEDEMNATGSHSLTREIDLGNQIESGVCFIEVTSGEYKGISKIIITE